MGVEATAPQVSTKDAVPWWHWLHKWTKWEQRETEVTSTALIVGGKRIAQVRHCVRCGFMQVHIFKASL